MIRRAVLLILAFVTLAACGRSAEDDDARVVPSTSPPAPTTTTTVPPQEPAYVVQPGDSLSTIAERFGTTVDEIARANDITNLDSITAGDELVIPPSSSTPGEDRDDTSGNESATSIRDTGPSSTVEGGPTTTAQGDDDTTTTAATATTG